MKSADWGISAKRYNPSRDKIMEVEVYREPGGEFKKAGVWERKAVVKVIESGATVITLPRVANLLVQGEEVHLVEINGEKYLRTDRNSIESDNLGNLPEF